MLRKVLSVLFSNESSRQTMGFPLTDPLALATAQPNVTLFVSGLQVNVQDVRPACLHTDVDVPVEGQEAIATGWGATSFGEDRANRLTKDPRCQCHFSVTVFPSGVWQAFRLCKHRIWWARGGNHSMIERTSY